MMRVLLTTKLPVSAETAFALVRMPALLRHIAAPVLVFAPLDPPAFPPVWQECAYLVLVRLGGFLPLGRQWIDISHENAPDGSFRMRDNGHGDLARRWDHRITITPVAEGCRYVDDVEIDAGLLTPFVWCFARGFYAHRQRRWRKLVAQDGGGIGELARQTAWRERLDGELFAFASARDSGDGPGQWRALERAHILSQVALVSHIHVHWLMLVLAMRQRDPREVAGQALRLVLAPLGSLTGRIPRGNTGRSTANAFTVMPIPPDLRDVLPY
jgi:hypothetical protein